MQRQTESTLNMSEITFTTSGPGRKAKNCFLFCFLRKLHCIACGLCLSSLKWGQIQVNSIERKHQAHKSRWSSRPERSCKYPQRGRLQAELRPSREGTSVTDRGHLTSAWGRFIPSCLELAVLTISDTPALLRAHQTASSAAHMVGANTNLGPQG